MRRTPGSGGKRFLTLQSQRWDRLRGNENRYVYLVLAVMGQRMRRGRNDSCMGLMRFP